MAGPKELVIRLQSLGGTWEIPGADRKRGIFAQDVSLEADRWGPSKASFSLRRDPTSFWPDLTPFTPVEIEEAGILVWSGRVSETPSTSGANRVMNVQCEGWQFHLDDDILEDNWVHARLSDFQDWRSFAGTQLGLAGAYAGGQVSSGDGIVTLMMPNAVPVTAGTHVGAYVDLGPGSGARSVSIDWEHSNNGGTSFSWNVWGSNAADNVTAPTETVLTGNLTGGAGPTTSSANFASGPWRYIALFLRNSLSTTPGADVWVKVRGLRIATQTAYLSSGLSVLKASTVMGDVVNRGTVLLNADQSRIQATSFNFVEYAPGEPRTPRQHIEAVNAPHNWLTQIDVLRRPVFKPLPSAPLYEVGPWSPVEVSDASANSGENIYNQVLLTGQTAASVTVRTARNHAQQPNVLLQTVASPAPDNPSFDVNTTSWTAGAGSTITRITVGFDTSPGAGQWANGGGGATTLTETFTGTFSKGVPYVLSFFLSQVAGSVPVTIEWGLVGTDSTIVHQPTTSSVIKIAWTPTVDRTGVTLKFTTDPGTVTWVIDTLKVSTVAATFVDRRGFRRTKILPISAAIDDTSGQVIGDAWLPDHKTSPFRGSVTLTGDRAVRSVLSGDDVPLGRLLLATGELLRFSDRADPDTGGHGRDGRIDSVSYTPASGTAQVTIDNSRANFEALLSRLDVLATASR